LQRYEKKVRTTIFSRLKRLPRLQNNREYPENLDKIKVQTEKRFSKPQNIENSMFGNAKCLENYNVLLQIYSYLCKKNH